LQGQANLSERARTAAPSRQAGGHWFEPSTAHHRNPRKRGGFAFLVDNGVRGRGRKMAAPRHPTTLDLPRSLAPKPTSAELLKTPGDALELHLEEVASAGKHGSDRTRTRDLRRDRPGKREPGQTMLDHGRPGIAVSMRVCGAPGPGATRPAPRTFSDRCGVEMASSRQASRWRSPLANLTRRFGASLS
jgi:hypothetical protein